MANFNISLADVCIHVSSLFPFVRVYCQDYLTEDAPDFSVSIKKREYFTLTAEGNITVTGTVTRLKHSSLSHFFVD